MKTSTDDLLDPNVACEANRAEVLDVYPNLRFTSTAQSDSVDAHANAELGLQPYLVMLDLMEAGSWPFRPLSEVAPGTFASDALVAWR
jgi:hypothetical protein